MIDLEALADLLREAGRHHTALGLLHAAAADLLTREPPAVPVYGFAAHVDAREPAPFAIGDAARADAIMGRELRVYPVAEMATHTPVDDDAEPPPSSHPFAANGPPAPPAADDSFPWDLPPDPHARCARKPAATWVPSATSWARTATSPLGMTCADTVAAYLASCPTRKVRPSERDFVRWVRANTTGSAT